MHRFRLLLATAAVAMLAACGSAAGGTNDIDPADADVRMTSVDMAFEESTLTVPAGESFTLALYNEDTMPHNVAIYTDEDRSEKLFEGVMVTDGVIVYEVPALEPGEYFLDCSLHPNMTGTLVVEG